MDSLGIGLPEILLILILAFLFFGPEKLPEITAKAGKLYRNLTKSTGELTKALSKEISLEKEQKKNSPTEQSQSVSQNAESQNAESQNAESQIDSKAEESSKEPVTSVAESDKESNG